MNDLPPAGWHTDPEDSSQYRYWDGRRWTDHRAAKFAPPPYPPPQPAPHGGFTPPPVPTLQWRRSWVVAGSVLLFAMLVSAVGWWAPDPESPTRGVVARSVDDQSSPGAATEQPPAARDTETPVAQQEPAATATSRPSPVEAESDRCRPDGNRMEIDASCFDEPWPLTVDWGILHCRDQAVTFVTAGRTYAVNGTALTWELGEEIYPIWAENPEIDGLRINIGPLIDAGLDLCE
jgi:hypothetical protein